MFVGHVNKNNRRRGDGFAMAGMLTHISCKNKDINHILEAHIFTVCPAAVPMLPTSATNTTDEEFMKNLGMIQGSDGSNESFERFILRTEVS
jgi:hypothetical protein